jgi:hypothetical protein
MHADVPSAFARHPAAPVATAPSSDHGEPPHDPFEPPVAVPFVVGYSITAAPPDSDDSIRAV